VRRFSSASYAGIPLIVRDRLQALASRQEGLRRVATLVARGGNQSEVFSAVAAEMARRLDVENADVFRYEDDGATIVAVAAFAEPGVPDHSIGERLTTEGETSRAHCGAPNGRRGWTVGQAPPAPLPNAFGRWGCGRGWAGPSTAAGPRSSWVYRLLVWAALDVVL
jgi:hypothetical protein